MGIVRKESTRGTLFSYIGTALGFVNQTFIFTYFLPVHIIGLLKVIQAFANILSKIGAFNVSGITIKFFPVFRDKEKKHNGFLTFSIVYSVVGFLIASFLAIIFKGLYIDVYVKNAPLFYEYFFLAFPLTFALILISAFNGYANSLFKISVPTFLREIVQRLLIILIIIFYHFGYITLLQYLILFVGVYFLVAIFSLIYIFYLGEYSFKLNFEKITKPLIRKIKEFAAWTYFSGIVRVFIFEIDKLMLAGIVGLYQTGIYSIAIVIGNIIDISMMNVVKITNPVISQAYKDNDLEKVRDVYYKTSITQFIIGGFFFILIWANAKYILGLMKPEYMEGLYVILIIGLTKMFNMLAGNSGGVILMSKYFKFNLLANLSGTVLAVILNLILIPKHGMIGAAIATMVAVASFNISKMVFIYIRFRFNPIKWNTFLAFIILCLTYLAVLFIPNINFSGGADIINSFLNIIVRSIVIVVIFSTLIIKLNVSDDITEFFYQILRRFNILKKNKS